MLTAPQWKRIPRFRKQDIDLGTGKVEGVTLVADVPTAGVTVRFDFGCETTTTTDNRETAFLVDLGVGLHFAEAFIVLSNPVSGNPETFRIPQPVKFEVKLGQVTRLELRLEPPSDLWRIVDVHLDADIHDRSFWGGDADAHHFNDPGEDRHFELWQDLEDEPQAPEDQRNTVLDHDEVWRTEPQVGSGVHVAVAITARLDPSDRSVHCHCEIALIDTDNGGFLGIGTSSNVDQLEKRDADAGGSRRSRPWPAPATASPPLSARGPGPIGFGRGLEPTDAVLLGQYPRSLSENSSLKSTSSCH